MALKIVYRDRVWEVKVSEGATVRAALSAVGLRPGVDVHVWRDGKIISPDTEVTDEDVLKLTPVLHGG